MYCGDQVLCTSLIEREGGRENTASCIVHHGSKIASLKTVQCFGSESDMDKDPPLSLLARGPGLSLGIEATSMGSTSQLGRPSLGELSVVLVSGACTGG